MRTAADRRIWTAAALGAAAVVAFCVGVGTNHYALRMLSKPWPVALMIAVLALRTRHRYGRLVTAGLVARVSRAGEGVASCLDGALDAGS